MRKLMWFAIGFGGACAFGAYCYTPWLLALSLLFFLIAALCYVGTRKFRNLRIACAVCVGICVGLLYFWGYNDICLEKARKMDDKTAWTSIEVCDYSFSNSWGCGFDGKVRIEGNTYKVRVYLNRYIPLEPGDHVRGEFRFVMTLSMDETSWSDAGKGIFLTAYQQGNCTPEKFWTVGWIHYPAIWRRSIQTFLANVFPTDTAGFASALLLGNKAGIDYETETALQLSGIFHIVAVSGLHVSIVFGCLYFAAGKKRVLTMLIGAPILLIFAAIAGFSPSITRACIMQVLIMLALLLEKEYDPPTALAFSAIVILLANPLSIVSVSFQLSFGCMAGMFLFCQRILDWLLAPKRFGRFSISVVRWICSSVAVSLSTMIFTAPLSAIHFGHFSIVGILTNMLTMWIVMAVFYGIILVCGFGCVLLPAAQAVAWTISWGIRYVVEASQVMSSMPLSAVYTESIYIVLWLIFAYVLLVVYLVLSRKPAVLFSSLVVCGLCVAVMLSWAEPMLDECRVTVLDVGQGQAILLQSDGKTFLVDCGGDYDEGAANTTAQTLLSQGIAQLDGVIVTHYDRDHCGGLPYLLTRIDSRNLYLPHAEDPKGFASSLCNLSDGMVTTVKEDMVLTYGNVRITIFAPLSYKSGNESSMCVLFQTENCDILITGDRDIQTEEMLLRRRDLPKLELLIAGHHGAKTSTGEALRKATQPEYVFISVGADNPYGHPAPEVLERLEKYGCIVYCTDEHGTLTYKG